MSKRPWYKRYGGDFIAGTMFLSLEEKGAYSICLDLMYDRDGRVPDDAQMLARVCGVSTRRWGQLRKVLVDAGKLAVEDGYLTNPRVSREVAERADESEARAEAGKKGGIIRAENAAKIRDKSEIAETKPNKNNGPDQAFYQKPEKEPPVVPQGDADLFGKPLEQPPHPDPVQAAFDQWNEMAGRWRLPVAVSLTDARRRAIAKRLADAGPEGWAQALKAVEKSSLCVGQAPPRPGATDPWRADLDFVCQAKSFNRLREGFYGNGAVPIEPLAGAVDPLDSWRFRVRNFQTDPGSWKRLDWGAPPGREPRSDEYACKAPDQVLGEFQIQPWGA